MPNHLPLQARGTLRNLHFSFLHLILYKDALPQSSRFLNCHVRHLGYVPRDENLHRAIMAQKPVVEAFPLSPASRALAQVADKLLNTPTPTRLESGFKFMWQRLLRETSPAPG